MSIDELIAALKEHFYVILHDEFVGKTAKERQLIRFFFKHPLLMPEIIVVNDQPHGFRSLSKRIRNLEKFSIICDIEFLELRDDVYLENFDLFSEFVCDLNTTYGSFLDLCKKYQKYVVVERLKRLDDPSFSSLVISSRIKDLLFDDSMVDDEQKVLFSTITVQEKIHIYLKKFTAFIKDADQLISK